MDRADGAQASVIRSARRIGEWLELDSPMAKTGPGTAEREELLAHLQGCLPQKWFDQLLVAGGVRVQGGKLRLHLFPAESPDVPADYERSVDVLYEDEFCLVAGKPAGMAVHPNAPGHCGTLMNAVAAHYEWTGQSCKVRHIHRLDDDTTGPVLYAKNRFAQLVLDEAMREKQIEREYDAFVAGNGLPAEGTIDKPIARDRHQAGRRRVGTTGERAITHFRVVERGIAATWVRLRLETGRTHQIRVHLASLGHPLIGDRLYGGPGELFLRQALHGRHLRFPHPWSGEPVQVEAPWPTDLQALYERLFPRPI